MDAVGEVDDVAVVAAGRATERALEGRAGRAAAGDVADAPVDRLFNGDAS